MQLWVYVVVQRKNPAGGFQEGTVFTQRRLKAITASLPPTPPWFESLFVLMCPCTQWSQPLTPRLTTTNLQRFKYPPPFCHNSKTVDKLPFRQITVVCFKILSCHLLNIHTHISHQPANPPSPLALFNPRASPTTTPTVRAACAWARVHSLWGAEGGANQVNLVGPSIVCNWQGRSHRQ